MGRRPPPKAVAPKARLRKKSFDWSCSAPARRKDGLTACLAHSMLVCSISAATVDAERPRPNFVFVMTDDQGWGDVSYNNVPSRTHLPGAGGERWVPNPPRTPHLDEMAAGPSTLLFHRFYASSPVCSPTRASFLTGRTHNRDGIQGAMGCGQSGSWLA